MANTPYIDLVKPAGTDKALISVLNANSDKIDSAVGGVQDALAIVCNGNTHGAITSGQFVYVRAHDTLQEGLYTANSNIAANATLSSSNLTANSSGGLNTLSEQIGTLNSNLSGLKMYICTATFVFSNSSTAAGINIHSITNGVVNSSNVVSVIGHTTGRAIDVFFAGNYGQVNAINIHGDGAISDSIEARLIFFYI